MSQPIAPAYAHSLPRSFQRLATDKELAEAKAAAEGMEALFIDYLMQQMRKTVPKDADNPFSLNNSATEIYQGMLDSAYAEKAAANNGMGLAKTLVEHLLPPGTTSGYNSINVITDSRREPYEDQSITNRSD